MNEKVSKIVGELVELHRQANEVDAKLRESESRVREARSDASAAHEAVEGIQTKIEDMNKRLACAIAEASQ